jgi:hypothetical protein
MPIDFDEIRKNAALEGVALSEISIIYADLTDDEIAAMERSGLVTHRNGKKLMAKFASDGTAMFPEKCVGVLTLAS